jgi:hypothetical protein
MATNSTTPYTSINNVRMSKCTYLDLVLVPVALVPQAYDLRCSQPDLPTAL